MPGVWPWVGDAGGRDMLVKQPLHPFKRPTGTLLTPSPELGTPEQKQGTAKLLQPMEVVGDTVVSLPAAVDRGQPSSDDAYRPVTTASQLQLDRRERATESFGHRDASQREAFPVSRARTNVGHPEEVERFALPSTFAFAFGSTVAAELDQSRFVGVEAQTEFLESFCQSGQAFTSV